MTIDEAIRVNKKEAKETRDLMPFWESRSEKHYKELEEFAKYYEQLAEWLTELKELKNSIGAVKLSNMKEALKLIRAYKAENIAQKKLIAEYKRLLKAAVEDMNDNNICYDLNPCNVCTESKNCPCGTFKWRYTDEALKLIGDRTDEKP